MTQISLAVIIPTRNRAEMAITAIRHLRDQRHGGDLRIYVSDNSSIDDEVRRLSRFCSELADPHVTYMRAPENTPSGPHWDWAVRQVLERSTATHLTVHYDRKVTPPGAVSEWFRIASHFPEQLITFGVDIISREPAPLRVWQSPWTGKAFRLKTQRIVDSTSRGNGFYLSHVLPILSNCLVPRATAQSIIGRFGSLCAATGGDAAFAFRFCALFDQYIHLDRALGVLYGSHRSAGLGYLTGAGGDWADYLRISGDGPWLDAAPVPGLNLGPNMIFHEYELVRREVGDRLPPLDRAACLRELAAWVGWIADPEQRLRVRRLLLQSGWDGTQANEATSVVLTRRSMLKMRVSQRLALLRADFFRRPLPSISGFIFSSDRRALRYALRYRGLPSETADHLTAAAPEEIDEATFPASRAAGAEAGR